MDQNAKRSQRAHNVSHTASRTSRLLKCTMLFTAATVLSFIMIILVASSPDGVLREQATTVAAQTPTLVVCSKPFQRSEKQRQEFASKHTASALLTSVAYSQAVLTDSCQTCESWPNGTFETFEAMLNYRTDAAQPTGASENSGLYWQLVSFCEQLTEAEPLPTTTCRIHRRDREAATNFSSTWQQNDTQPQAPVGTAGPSSSVETNKEYKFFPTPHLGDAARGPQQTTLSPQVATHVKVDTAQQSMCDHFKAPAHMRSIETDLPPNTNAQALLHIAYNGQILLTQALQHVVPMLNMIMQTLLPILTTSAWLSLSMLATAMSIYAETSRTQQSSNFVQHHLPLQAFAILVSVLCMMSTLTMFVLTQLHCMLTLATAYSFLTHSHWISACLMMICSPQGMQQLLAGLTQAKEHAIQSVVKHPKQPKFAHPNIRHGRY